MDPMDVYDNLRTIANNPMLLAGTTKFNYAVEDGTSSDKAKNLQRLLDQAKGAPFFQHESKDFEVPDSFWSEETWQPLLVGLDAVQKLKAVTQLGKSQIPLDAILAKATPAPFGHGSETVYDESVRDAWEIPADRLGSKLTDILETVCAAKVTSGMAPPQGPKGTPKRIWKLVPYKMHIYGRGGKFAPHIDTLHADNHVATLVVGLPSDHRGGALEVTFQGETKVADFSRNPGHFQATCFFTDCQHEIKKVTKGHRVVIQYDIYEEAVKEKAQKQKPPPAHDDLEVENYSEEMDESYYNYNHDACYYEEDTESEDGFYKSQDVDRRLNSLGYGKSEMTESNRVLDKTTALALSSGIKEFIESTKEKGPIGIFLSHRYPNGALSSEILKGCDRLLFDILKETDTFDLGLQGVITEITSDWSMGEIGWLSFSKDSFKIYDINPKQVEKGIRIPKDPWSYQFRCESLSKMKAKPDVSVFLPGHADHAFRKLRHQGYIEYTGNDAQSAELVYYQAILLVQLKADGLESEGQGKRDEDNGKKLSKKKMDADVGILEAKAGSKQK